VLLLAPPALRAAPEDDREARAQRSVSLFTERNRREYKRETERLRAILEALGWSVPPPAEVVSLPEPRRITIKVARRAEEPAGYKLSGRDFVAGVQVARTPYATKFFRKNLSGCIADAPNPGRDPEAYSKFTREWAVGGVYAADDFTARTLGLPRSIPLLVKGTVAHVSRGACGYTFDYKGLRAKRKGRQAKRVSCEKIEYEAVDDLSGLLRKGTGDINSIGIDLSGTNLDYHAGTRSLRPIAPGPIKPPGKVTFSRLKLRKIVFVQGKDAAKRYSPEEYHVVQLPEKGENFSFSDECNGAIRTGKMDPRDAALGHWEQGRRKSRAWVPYWRRSRVKDPYEQVPTHQPQKAVSFKDATLIVRPLRGAVGQASSDATDLFFEPNAERLPMAAIDYHAVVYDGSGDTVWDALTLLDRIEATPGPFEVSTSRVLALGAVGQTKVTLSLADGGYAKTHTFTANQAELGVQAPVISVPYGTTHRVMRTLALDKPSRVYVMVRGPADMGKYRVNWRNSSDWTVLKKRDMTNRNLKFAFAPESSRFSKVGDLWIASAEVTAPSQAVRESLEFLLKDRASGKPFTRYSSAASCTIYGTVATPDGGELLQLRSGWLRLSSPPLTGVALKAGHEWTRGPSSEAEPSAGPFHLFVTDGDRGLRLFADLQYAGKPPLLAENVPLGTGSTDWIRVQQDTEHRLAARSGRIIAGGDEVGRAQLRAVVRSDEAAAGFVALPKGTDTLSSPPLEVTVNRAHLIRTTFAGLQEWTVAVEGPADLSKYSTQWQVAGKKPRKRSFNQGSWKSSVELEGREQLEHVDVLDPAGVTVARLNPGNTKTIAPLVTVRGPRDHFIQGAFYEIIVEVENLPVDVALYTACKWSIPPRFKGELVKTSTTLTLAKGAKHSDPSPRLASKTIVRFAEDRSTAGKFPPIAVELKARGLVVGRGELSNRMLVPGPSVIEDIPPDELRDMVQEYREHKKEEREQERTTTEVNTLQIDNIRGNNPWNTEQPVNNFDNQTFDNVGQALDAQRGGGDDGGQAPVGGDTFPKTVSMTHPGGPAPADRRFGSLTIDPNTGAAQLFGDSNGSALAVQTPPDVGGADGAVFRINPWTLVDPPGIFADLTNNVPRTITIRHTPTGRTYRVTLTIIPKGGDEYDLRVSSVTRV